MKFGLNSRGGGSGVSGVDHGVHGQSNASQKKRKTKKNVLDGSSSSSEDENETSASSGRAQVNRQLQAEQDALRKRAQAAAAAISSDSNIYDYDGAYDSFAQATTTATTQDDSSSKEKSSRYVGDLLQAAKKRQLEREMIHERKVAKEQAMEDQQGDFKGKEKFITNAYKRKLEERKRWELEDQEKARQEEENNVTKHINRDAFVGSFYGNFTKNSAMGGTGNTESNTTTNSTSETDKQTIANVIGSSDDDRKARLGNHGDDSSPLPSTSSVGTNKLGFLAGFERSTNVGQDVHEGIMQDRDHYNDKMTVMASPEKENHSEINDQVIAPSGESKRRMRERKVAQARIRYLERRKQ